jgi:hypothetical protein
MTTQEIEDVIRALITVVKNLEAGAAKQSITDDEKLNLLKLDSMRKSGSLPKAINRGRAVPLMLRPSNTAVESRGPSHGRDSRRSPE